MTIRHFEMVKYTGDLDTLEFDFNLPPHITSAVMSRGGYVNAIVNGGSHATVHYYTDLNHDNAGVVILLPLSLLEPMRPNVAVVKVG